MSNLAPCASSPLSTLRRAGTTGSPGKAAHPPDVDHEAAGSLWFSEVRVGSLVLRGLCRFFLRGKNVLKNKSGDFCQMFRLSWEPPGGLLGSQEASKAVRVSEHRCSELV